LRRPLKSAILFAYFIENKLKKSLNKRLKLIRKEGKRGKRSLTSVKVSGAFLLKNKKIKTKTHYQRNNSNN